MVKKHNEKKKILIFFVLIIGASSYIFANKNFVLQVYWDLYFLLKPSPKKQEFINKYIFPYKFIKNQSEAKSKLEKNLKSIGPLLAELELYKKNSGSNIETVQSSIKLSGTYLSTFNNTNLQKYKLTSGFYSGINNLFPGSGYIDFYKNDLIIISSRGVLAFSKDFPSNKVIFKQIENNFNQFLDLNQFKKSIRFSIKDLLILGNKIFISYTEEVSDDCWNTSIVYGKMDYQKINFEKLFSSQQCVHSTNNLDNEFQVHQSGGRMINYDDNNIIFSTGDYRSRHLAQNIASVNGKLIKINLKNQKYKIISMGHRNPQGLYFDKEKNFILETEHGPMGGDEINLLKEIKSNKNKIYNFGWAISSAGEHYGGKIQKNKKKYEKYPLHKSHSDHGFIEPLKSFVPSIGISEIVRIDSGNYVVSSLKDKSLYFFTLKDASLIENLNRVEVGERIRDLKFKDNNLYMFLEDTASIGVLNLK